MKKIFVVIFVMATLICAYAQADTIMNNHVYDKIEYDEFDVLNHLSDGEEYVSNNTYYCWESNCCITEETIGMSLSEVEDFCTELYRSHGLTNIEVTMRSVGNDVVWMNMTSEQDLTTFDGFFRENVNELGPIYTVNVVMWRDCYHMH